ncbi:hypothetical protein [Streptomyces anulatus]|uniref:hypothetical protein n=1 Tax=Streptomyces anulatus TaxID=1892 RepID=UPI00344856F4
MPNSATRIAMKVKHLDEDCSGRRPPRSSGETIGLAIDTEADIAHVSDLGGHMCAIPLPCGSAAGEGEREIASFSFPLTGISGPTP